MSDTKRLEAKLHGVIRLARVVSINRYNYRAVIDFLDPFGHAKDVVANPSPVLGTLPVPGSLVAVYDPPDGQKRILYVLADLLSVETRSMATRMAEGEDKPGTIPRGTMNPGDVYIGRGGRAVFSSGGSAHISSQMCRSVLELEDSSKGIRMSGINFELFSFARGTRIASETALNSPTFGDSLVFERNVPLPGMADVGPAVIPTNISRLNFDDVGNCHLDIQSNTVEFSSWLDMSAGDIELANMLSSVKLSVNGVASIWSKIAPAGVAQSSLYLYPSGATELQSGAYPNSTVLSMDATGRAAINSYNAGSLYISPAIGTGLVSNSQLGLDVSLTNTVILGDTKIAPTSPRLIMSASGLTELTGFPKAGTSLVFGADGSISLSSATSIVTTSSTASIVAGLVNLGSLAAPYHVAYGEGMTSLISLINSLIVMLKTHMHSGPTTPLGTSGPPIPPLLTAPAIVIPPAMMYSSKVKVL